MRLYSTDAGRWAGNRNDAARLARADGGAWSLVDVPTDKTGLIEWLNARTFGQPRPLKAVEPPASSGDPAREEQARRISVEEEIQNCDLPRLAVLAENVAWRFHELARDGAAGSRRNQGYGHD